MFDYRHHAVSLAAGLLALAGVILVRNDPPALPPADPQAVSNFVTGVPGTFGIKLTGSALLPRTPRPAP